MSKLKDISTARYALERNYTINNLMTMLAVYDEWLANSQLPKSQQVALWEIAAKLKINKLAINDAQSAAKEDRHIGRNTLAATVSRYVRQAKAVIANTAEGKFPLA